MLIDDLNRELRIRAIAEATSSIEFLNAEIEKTEIASMRETLFYLIEEQMRTRTLAEVRKSYAVSVIDPPMLPEEKIFPIRWLICLAAAVLGGFLAAFAIVVREFNRRPTESA
jgi:LPS O-antigen subunit length determinant protein (WzzB/FepE family)